MPISLMRHKLCQLYGGAWSWVNKVQKMPDKQVVAVYMRLLRAGRIH